MKIEYKECDECRVKPGSPILCLDCWERLCEHSKTGFCRPPRICSKEVQEQAKLFDKRMENFKWPEGFQLKIESANRLDE